MREGHSTGVMRQVVSGNSFSGQKADMAVPPDSFYQGQSRWYEYPQNRPHYPMFGEPFEERQQKLDQLPLDVSRSTSSANGRNSKMQVAMAWRARQLNEGNEQLREVDWLVEGLGWNRTMIRALVGGFTLLACWL